jgi:hypothetical protein
MSFDLSLVEWYYLVTSRVKSVPTPDFTVSFTSTGGDILSNATESSQYFVNLPNNLLLAGVITTPASAPCHQPR